MNTRRLFVSCAVLIAGICADSSSGDESAQGPYWSQDSVVAQNALENALNSVPTAVNLRHLHELMCAEPHPAGSDADARMIETLRELFIEYGLDAQVHEIFPLLAKPVHASVSVSVLGREYPEGDRTMQQVLERIELPVHEPEFASDKFSSHDDLTIGWNAYSGTGKASGEVVYANFGTKDDFETLKQHGIDVRGRIVLARYGGNFRGFKAKFAEQAGARGLLIYTDPKDSGYTRGLMYPDGGWAHGGYIQNGSIKTLPYPGDPLTPGVEATKDAKRLDASAIALPTIPVQPIGWDAAQQIMERMTGDALPSSLRRSWQGGLPLAYRLTGGESLRVQMDVVQERSTMRTANVLGIVEGSTFPEQVVVVGCHFDAWSFGAGDPQAGSIVLMEMARSFGAAAHHGQRPARTVIFANWGAEEFGIIGSTEWVEANREHLLKNAVAYINLDMAAMGPNFRCSSAPSLKKIIADAARVTPQAGDPAGGVVFERWTGDMTDEPSYGTLGGGSDHVGFYCHVGVPSCGFGAGGSDGVSYHSNSDNLAWYWKVVGDDYEPALMLTRLGNVLAARLANADLVPLDPVRYARDVRKHLETLESMATQRGVTFDATSVYSAIDAYERNAVDVMQTVHAAVEAGSLPDEDLATINGVLITLERSWLCDDGLPDRPWYRSLYAATDPSSGYGAWLLPGLRGAIESGDGRQVESELAVCRDVIEALTGRIDVIGALAGHDDR